jgi:hypothetical protein
MGKSLKWKLFLSSYSPVSILECWSRIQLGRQKVAIAMHHLCNEKWMKGLCSCIPVL